MGTQGWDLQQRPDEAFVGTGDADHCWPQDVRDNPESSNRSWLPEKNTRAQSRCRAAKAADPKQQHG